MSVDIPARHYCRYQFWGAIGINILQGVGIDLNRLSGAGITTSLFVELKADRFWSLGQLEDRSAVAAFKRP